MSIIFFYAQNLLYYLWWKIVSFLTKEKVKDILDWNNKNIKLFLLIQKNEIFLNIYDLKK
jgi:hypothetical protein